ncbi:TIGR03621 family F420-dependent LLM class oxidoreductase [Mycobacterium sp. MUNTM1]
MTPRPLKLGLQLIGLNSVPEMAEEARRAEELGFDVVLLGDHLGMTAPLAPLPMLGAAAPSLQVGNMVLNTAFYRPPLLARDLASVDSATGGRLIIGLGAGYIEQEFAAAGLPFPSPGARVKLLTEHVTEIRRLLSDPAHIPAPVQAPPPIMIAGAGDKLLTMAAQHADVVAVGSMGSEADLAERVAFVKNAAGARADDIELQFGFFQVSIDDPSDLSILNMVAPGVPEVELRKLTTLIDVPVEAAVERVQRLHEELGISYFTFNRTPGTSWDTFAKLVSTLR